MHLQASALWEKQIRRFLIGSVSEKVIRNAKPVLIVRQKASEIEENME